MVIQENLCSFHIIERDLNNHILLTWSYPSIQEDNRKLILNNVKTFKSIIFYYIFSNNKWIYIFEQNSKMSHLNSFIICIITTDYKPQRLKKLCSILWNKYENTNNGVDLVKIYLSVFMKNSYPVKQNGSLTLQDFEHYNEETHIKDIIRHFGVDFIILYVALLLKKRIIVYHSDISILQQHLESITKLVEKVNPAEYLRPFIQSFDDVKGKMHYVAGTINKNIVPDTNISDIFIDVLNYQITIQKHAKEHLNLTKFHKEFAKQLNLMANTKEVTEQEVLNEINKKTEEVYLQLKSLTTINTTDNKCMITLEELRSKKFNSNLENFLFNYALAENMLIL